ncbi:MAG: hypothetical protein JO255_11605 [Alphaproteobacteria bacterium]|nr:hypothetical protein [Alphaproteobacteria bacterium]
MQHDITELVGVLMRIVGGGETSIDEIEELTFDCADYLRPALDEAFIKLLEFAHDRDLRARNMELDLKARSELDRLLDRIARLCETRDPHPTTLRSAQRAGAFGREVSEDRAA